MPVGWAKSIQHHQFAIDQQRTRLSAKKRCLRCGRVAGIGDPPVLLRCYRCVHVHPAQGDFVSCLRKISDHLTSTACTSGTQYPSRRRRMGAFAHLISSSTASMERSAWTSWRILICKRCWKTQQAAARNRLPTWLQKSQTFWKGVFQVTVIPHWRPLLIFLH